MLAPTKTSAIANSKIPQSNLLSSSVPVARKDEYALQPCKLLELSRGTHVAEILLIGSSTTKPRVGSADCLEETHALRANVDLRKKCPFQVEAPHGFALGALVLSLLLQELFACG